NAACVVRARATLLYFSSMFFSAHTAASDLSTPSLHDALPIFRSAMTSERRVDSVEERRAWLALWRIPGIGPQTFARLLEHCGSIAPVFSLPRAELQRLQLPPAIQDALREPPWEQAEADLRWLERPGRHLLTWGDPGYPQQLQDIPAAPPLLFALGDPALLQRPQLAIVGSRNPTAGGVQIAEQFAEHLAAAGLAITSGLAEGIDAAAHRGALAGGGATIAATATGLDRVYPARNR